VAIGISSNRNTIYVAYNGDNSVYVINVTNNTNIGKDIHVGKNPLDAKANGIKDGLILTQVI
jgi:YVTN family beta-propeller protein